MKTVGRQLGYSRVPADFNSLFSIRVLRQRVIFPKAAGQSTVVSTNASVEVEVPSMLAYENYKVESRAPIDCEEFVMSCVWDIKYSSAVFGKRTRPPMAAVALDMIELIKCLFSISDQKPRPVAYWLQRFFESRTLRSLNGMKADLEWVVQGFLFDMFQVVAQVQEAFPSFVATGLDSVHKQRLDQCRHRKLFGPPSASFANSWLFPSGDCLGIRGHSALAEGLWRSLDDFDAKFIASGPFQIVLSTVLADHLTLGDHREIRVFWGGAPVPFPWATLFRFELHALGRLTSFFSKLNFQGA